MKDLPLLGRAALLEAWLRGKGDDARRAQNVARFASLIGFTEVPTAGVSTVDRPIIDAGSSTTVDPPPAQIDEASPFDADARWAPIPFWRQVERRPHPGRDDDARSKVQTIPEADLRRRGERPPTPPLMSKARLARVLDELLAAPHTSRTADVPRIVGRIARSLPIVRLPRLQRARLSSHVVVVVDRSTRTIPVWSDQDRVLDQLKRLLGPRHVTEWLLPSGPNGPILADGGVRLDVSVPAHVRVVLVLGDLGLHGSRVEQAAWLAFGAALRRGGCMIAALVPASRSTWTEELRRDWRCMVWDDVARRDAPSTIRSDADRLLGLLATAPFVEPGLLRAVRQAAPGRRPGIDAEFVAWGRLRGGLSDARVMDAGVRERARAMRQGLIEHSPDWVVAARRHQRRWHRSAWILTELEEAMAHSAEPASPSSAKSSTSEIEIIATIRALEERLLQGDERLGKWVENARRRLPRAVLDSPTLGRPLRRLATAARTGGSADRSPARFALSVEAERLSVVDSDLDGRLSIGAFESCDRSFDVVELPDGGVTTVARHESWAPRTPSLRIETDIESSRFEQCRKPPGVDRIWMDRDGLWVAAEDGDTAVRARWAAPQRAGPTSAEPGVWRVLPEACPGWASRYGCDDVGFWAEVDVDRVEFRFRWVPGGRFRMGSPDTEAGRFEDEEQHEVELSGFWIGETPVTQTQWNVVTGLSPSDFDGASRPVENVSWDDCRAMMQKLETRVPGLAPRFPTESEWEYGCRGGTTAATYVGDLTLDDRGLAAELDAIAWYAENSQASTQEVKLKRPNAFGLYDTLGNVWEWCADWLGGYPIGNLRDPSGPAEGSERVLRGGSCTYGARGVRAAYRLASLPGSRDSHFGFRLARGQGSENSRAAEPQERSDKRSFLQRIADRVKGERGTRDPGRGPGDDEGTRA